MSVTAKDSQETIDEDPGQNPEGITQARKRRAAGEDTGTLSSMSQARPLSPLTAFANLKKICEEHLKGKYRIEVIDLLKEPPARQGRPDTCHPHACQKTSRTDKEDNRRPLEYRAGARRA